MNNQLIKPIAVGILVGVVLYFIPFFFVGKVIFLLLIALVFYKFFRRRRYHYRWQFADRIRSMSDEEYEAFKTKYDAPGKAATDQNESGKEEQS